MRPAATARPAKLPATVWRLALAAGLASYLDAATFTSFGISLIIWREHYQLADWKVGLLSAGMAFSVTLGALVGGWLGDRWGPGRVFTADLALFLIGLVLVVAAPNGDVLTVGVIVTGTGVGADVPTSLAVISRAAPLEGRGRLIGVTQVLWIAGILTTFVLGFLVSTLGYLGTQILVSHLIVLAALTLVLRLTLIRRLEVRGGRDRDAARAVTIHQLVRPDTWPVLMTTGVFYLFWNCASTGVSTYGPYYLVTVTGLSQSQATGLVLLTFPLALVMSVVFVRLADTVWRNRLFLVAMPVQVTAFTVGGLTGGRALWGMVALIVLYSLSNVFAGEAAYRVWSQLLLAADVRSTGMGLTYAVAHAVAACFMFVVPALVADRPAALLWIMAGCVTVSGIVGLLITHPFRRLTGGWPTRRDGRHQLGR